MKHLRVTAFGLLLISVLFLGGCAWTGGMRGKIWGDDEKRKAQQSEPVTKQNEAPTVTQLSKYYGAHDGTPSPRPALLFKPVRTLFQLEFVMLDR